MIIHIILLQGIILLLCNIVILLNIPKLNIIAGYTNNKGNVRIPV